MTYSNIAEQFKVAVTMIMRECKGVLPSKPKKKRPLKPIFKVGPDGTLVYSSNTSDFRRYNTFEEAERWLNSYTYMLINWQRSDLPEKIEHIKQIKKEIAYILALLKKKS